MLNRDRKRTITDRIAALILEGFADGQPSKFWAEGPARFGLRSSLCLQGWEWTPADTVAAEIVAGALAKVGARRPGWYEGQPEWTQPGALPIERDTCLRCHKPLPEGHRRFCSHVCSAAYNSDRRRQAKGEEVAAAHRAYMAVWSAKQPDRICEGCGQPYRPKKPAQRFCSPECVTDTYLRRPAEV